MIKRCLVAAGFCVMLVGQSVAVESDPVIASIGQKQIRVSDLERIISHYPEDKQLSLRHDPNAKATLLSRFVQGMVLGDLARKEGLESEPRVREQINLMANDILALEYLKQRVTNDVVVTEKDIDLYYRAYKTEFRLPEMVRVRDILIAFPKDSSEAQKQVARQKAESLLSRILAGEDFATLAREYSDDQSSKNNGGDLGLLPRGRMMPELEKIAFSLKTGEVAGPVETGSGYFLIKSEGKVESSFEPYEQVKERIRERLMADFKKARVQEFMEKLYRQEGVKINTAPLMKDPK